MKNAFQLAALLIASVMLFGSCSKDGDNGKFDASNPVGYVVAGTFRHSFIYPTVNQPLVMKFIAGNKLEYSTHFNSSTKSYIMSNDTFYIQGGEEEWFVIKDEVVTRYVYATDLTGFTLSLQKVPGNNALEGKTFTGKYYKPDGSVLHNSFFYSFTTGLKLNAGYTVGTIERTNDYGSISNIASRSSPAAGQVEFTMLVNGKLYATYSTGSILQYGNLDPQ